MQNMMSVSEYKNNIVNINVEKHDDDVDDNRLYLNCVLNINATENRNLRQMFSL